MPAAIILCGGRATRLASLHGDRPKALVPVAGRPFLEWQLAWLARGGVRRVHLAGGHLADQLVVWGREVSGVECRVSERDPDSSPFGVRCSVFDVGCSAFGPSPSTLHPPPSTVLLSLSVEPRPLGTGGGLRYAADFVEGDALLVINGDTLLPGLDIQGLEAAAAGVSKGWTSIAVARVGDAARFGTVAVEGGRVVEFVEKGRSASGWINGGVYRMCREAVASIPADATVSLETDLFPAWAREGRIAALPAAPPLLDMGTPDGLAEMERWLGVNRWP
ncbi:MAG: NTP transferase domain-containing protein [Verrucomicrobia bacterium]|nr:NTP transferase domain-containing protein [Verrucomicrobiota bacterium]